MTLTRPPRTLGMTAWGRALRQEALRDPQTHSLPKQERTRAGLILQMRLSETQSNEPLDNSRYPRRDRTMSTAAEVQSAQAKLKTWLLVAAASVTIFGFFHHVDHVVRGNRSGWPFEKALTPFTFSLLIYAL